MQTLDGVDTLVLTAGGLTYRPRRPGPPRRRRGPGERGRPADHERPGRSRAPGWCSTPRGPRCGCAATTSGFVSLVAWKADLVLRGTESAPLRVSSWDTDGAARTPSRRTAGPTSATSAATMRLTHVEPPTWASGPAGRAAWPGPAVPATSATGRAVGSSFLANHYGAFASQADALTISDPRSRPTPSTGCPCTGAPSRRRRPPPRRTTTAGTASRPTWDRRTVPFEDVPLGRQRRPRASASAAAPLGGPVRRRRAGPDLRRTRGRRRRAARQRRGRLAGRRGRTDVVRHRHPGRRQPRRDRPGGHRRLDQNGGHRGHRRHRLGISATGGAATVSGNRVEGGLTGIRVQDAAAKVIGNDMARGRPGTPSRSSARRPGSSLVDNTIAGRGPSGLDIFRLDPELSDRAGRQRRRGLDPGPGQLGVLVGPSSPTTRCCCSGSRPGPAARRSAPGAQAPTPSRRAAPVPGRHSAASGPRRCGSTWAGTWRRGSGLIAAGVRRTGAGRAYGGLMRGPSLSSPSSVCCRVRVRQRIRRGTTRRRRHPVVRRHLVVRGGSLPQPPAVPRRGLRRRRRRRRGRRERPAAGARPGQARSGHPAGRRAVRGHLRRLGRGSSDAPIQPVRWPGRDPRRRRDRRRLHAAPQRRLVLGRLGLHRHAAGRRA